MNNPTEREQQIAREAAEKLLQHCGEIRCNGAFPDPDAYNLFLAAIQDANQQGNEDAARLEADMDNVDAMRLGKIASAAGSQLRTDCGDRIDRGLILRRLLEEEGYGIIKLAARGVQPDAKEGEVWPGAMETTYCPACDVDTRDAHHLSSCPAAKEKRDWDEKGECRKCGEHYGTWYKCRDPKAGWPAAQQESAPEAEQAELLNKAKLLRSVLKKTDYDATTWNMAKVVADELLELIEGASSPAQDKPVAESVELHRLRDDIAAEAAIANRDDPAHPRTEATMKAIGAVLNTWVARLDAALSASSPSEQKSSLPAETLSAQEQDSQEKGHV